MLVKGAALYTTLWRTRFSALRRENIGLMLICPACQALSMYEMGTRYTCISAEALLNRKQGTKDMNVSVAKLSNITTVKLIKYIYTRFQHISYITIAFQCAYNSLSSQKHLPTRMSWNTVAYLRYQLASLCRYHILYDSYEFFYICCSQNHFNLQSIVKWFY